MNMRSSRRMVTFSRPFTLPGYADQFPAGAYEILIEEEQMQGLSFEAHRRTATFMTVHRRGGRTEMRQIREADLAAALADDTASRDARDGALSPQENQK
ncbi:hypothetical protein FDP22_16595 [Paroceanicella profunda]|uniref:Uncharacterized protein n=1 Tax=Paroceanicella profunda TaxID=2579971 RepID=A0A5B8G1X4_9RHOB|nr:hypothetical protein [Paroceanicella profunda]QDL93259.1 hypothetical protein FDP22_16595 [Paroceanicella profunda]